MDWIPILEVLMWSILIMWGIACVAGVVDAACEMRSLFKKRHDKE